MLALVSELTALGADPRAAVKRWQDACIQGVAASCDTLAKLYTSGGPAIRPNSRTALTQAMRRATSSGSCSTQSR